MLTVVAAYTSEPPFQIAAIQELVDDLRDDRAQDAVAGLVAFLVDIQERIEMLRQALPQWRCLGLPGTIDLLHHAAQCRKEGASSNGIPLKKV